MKKSLLKFFSQSLGQIKSKTQNTECLTVKGEKRQIKKHPCIEKKVARGIEKDIGNKTCLSEYFSCLKGLNFYERNCFNNGTIFARENGLATLEYNRKERQQSPCFYR